MSRTSVWAVFSSHRPEASLQTAVDSVAAQVGGVVVVDDASGPEVDALLARLAAGGALVHRQAENGGIAAALNEGSRIARAQGAVHVLTLDQDSVVPAGFVQALLDARAAAHDTGLRVGAVVPEYFAGVRQAAGPAAGFGTAAHAIQSGMLVPLAVVDEIGELRADYFIDLVDTEYELRLRRHGFAVITAPGQRLGHALGRTYRRELFGRPLRLPGIPPEFMLSTPFRYFYRVRNRLVLNREYFTAAPTRILRDTLLDGILFVNALWVARPRRSLWRVYRAGISAALRHRMGPMPAALAPLAARIRWTAPEVEEPSP